MGLGLGGHADLEVAVERGLERAHGDLLGAGAGVGVRVMVGVRARVGVRVRVRVRVRAR